MTQKYESKESLVADHEDQKTIKKGWGPGWLFAVSPAPAPTGGPERKAAPTPLLGLTVAGSTGTAGRLQGAPQGQPEPLPWRAEVAGWPLAWREQWGRQANALEDTGLGWREAERQAFEAMTREE